MTKTVAIWNPASGSAPDEDDLRSALGPDAELVETTEDDPGAGQAADAVGRGATIVVACGGDGTVRACLAPLAHTDTALGIVPLGTGNLLASNLGIESGLGAATHIGRGDGRRIDIGSVNGEAFAVMAGTGFDALMIRDADDTWKARLGTIAYVFSAARHLRSELVHTKVQIDGEPWFTGRTSMVLVGNFGRISGGVEVFPAARPDDGRLDVAVMTASTVRQWVSIAWRLARKQPMRMDLARRSQGSRIVVDLDHPRVYELDGEDRDEIDHLEFVVDPDAIAIAIDPRES